MRARNVLPFVVLAIAAAGCSSTADSSTAPTDSGVTPDAPDTPDATCSDPGPASAEWPSWPAPPDVPPSSEYTVDSAAGTVTDAVTGLTWLQAIPETRFTWQDARAHCACLSIAGHDDWRLPNRVELASIIDYGVSGPAVVSTVFPNTPADWTWTASPYPDATVQPWAVSFDRGMVTSYGEGVPIETETHNFARCVRGPAGRTDAPEYVVSDATVLDPVTQLTWQRIVPGDAVTYPDAVSRCAALTIAGATWRLPTVKELESLFGGATPTFATSSPFELTAGQIPAYWTSTSYATAPGINRWSVFETGDALPNSETPTSPTFYRSALCVHGAAGTTL